MNKGELLQFLEPFSDEIDIYMAYPDKDTVRVGRCEFHFDCPEPAFIVLAPAKRDIWDGWEFENESRASR